MPVPCYTCGELITFSDKKLSKTGRKIPLNLDESNHEHDENGKPKLSQQTQQFNQYNKQPQQQPYTNRLQVVAQKTAQLGNESQSRGGSYLDTKRIRVMLEEHSKEIQEMKMMLNEILNARTILDTNRYEGKNDQIYNVMKPFLNTQGVVASELLKDQKRDPLSINHGKIADLNEVKQRTKIVTEEQDFPIEQTLKDDEDDDNVDDDEQNNNNKGVIDDL